MDDQSIKDDLHDMRSSSLAIPTGMEALSSGPDPGTPSVAVRVGVTGAICDLEDEGRLDEILPLLAKEQELTSKLGRDELQLRRCHDHRWMLSFIRSHRGRGIKKALE